MEKVIKNNSEFNGTRRQRRERVRELLREDENKTL